MTARRTPWMACCLIACLQPAHAADWHSLGATIAQDFGDLAHWPLTVFRVLLAGLLGTAMGWLRETHGKAAGVRTHSLVAMGAALLVAVTMGAGGTVDTASRVIQGIIAGIGFLGAGTILKRQENGAEAVHGLTAGAGIWFTAAMGVAAGLGQAWTAIICTGLALLVIVLVRKPES